MNEERERYTRKQRNKKNTEQKAWIGVLMMGVFFLIMWLANNCSHGAHLIMPE